MCEFFASKSWIYTHNSIKADAQKAMQLERETLYSSIVYNHFIISQYLSISTCVLPVLPQLSALRTGTSTLGLGGCPE